MGVRLSLIVLAALVVLAGGAQARVASHQPLPNHAPGWDEVPNDWSPNGRRIVYSRTFDPPASGVLPGDVELGVMNSDGTLRRRLVHKPRSIFEQWDSEARWSPDGSQIVFTRFIGLSNDEVFIVDAGGGVARNLTNSPAQEDSASWSSDGKQLAFRREDSDQPERSGIWIMKPDGSAQVQVTNGDDYSPIWSPDGQTIFFSRLKTDIGAALFVVTLGQTPRPVTTFGDNDQAGWSPDGKLLLFERGGDVGNPSIWTMRLDGTGKRKLTEGGEASWSPDGTKLVLTRHRPFTGGERLRTFVADRNGRHARLIFRGGRKAIWSPDGKRIALVATQGCRGSGVYVVRVADGAARRISNDCSVLGTAGKDRLLGTNERDLIYGFAGNDFIDANPGDRPIVYSGRLDDDLVLAGPGNDYVVSGGGNDLLVGGPGRDYLNGERGNDLIRARDGEQDVIVCGPGRDRVIADLIDEVSSDCESVRY